VLLASETGHERHDIVRILVVVSRHSARYAAACVVRRRGLVDATVRLHSTGGGAHRRRRVGLPGEMPQAIAPVILPRPDRAATCKPVMGKSQIKS